LARLAIGENYWILIKWHCFSNSGRGAIFSHRSQIERGAGRRERRAAGIRDNRKPFFDKYEYTNAIALRLGGVVVGKIYQERVRWAKY
jgi:ribosomal protein L44E